MHQTHSGSITIHLVLSLIVVSALFTSIQGQVNWPLSEMKQKAEGLVEQTKYTEALPLLEKIVVAEPENARMHFYLGFALIAQAAGTTDEQAQKALRVRAREAFIKSRSLGNTEPLVAAMIENLPPDGTINSTFSPNIQANRSMIEAEAFFGQGKLDDALSSYQAAFKLDPNLYYAALFSGDVYMQKEDFKNAEIWYQKAIAIDPYKETAYRYSATPLMKQRRYDEARDRYIEAYICEPYNRFAVSGISQWAKITNATLAHPNIEIPTDVTFDEKGNARINLGVNALVGGKDDGSFAWLAYGTTRTLWHKEKFAKAFPNEATYRHSLPEEAEALRAVLDLATSDKKVKTLNPSLERLKRLNDEGLLEVYILLARRDAGIARDYLPYLKTNREKLRRYVVDYVVTGGGK